MVELDDARSLAARVAARANLRDVQLFKVAAELEEFPGGSGELGFNFDSKIEIQKVDSTLVVDGTYDLSIFMSDADESANGESAPDRKQLAHASFQLGALYVVDLSDDEPPFREDELDAFAQTTGLLALHPYAREFIASLTGRLGLPALHIGNVQVLLDKRNPGHD